MEKTLSIIVPAYNMETYLPKCLGSLVVGDKDTLAKLEVLVVNDGSKDSTSEIAHRYEAKHPGVFRVIDKENGHYGSCTNRGLKEATGRFVKVVDADDYVNTDALSRLVELLFSIDLDKEKIDMVVSDYAEVNVHGKVLKRSNYAFPIGAAFQADVFPRNMDRIPTHCICYRTGLLREINYRQTEGMSYTDLEWILEPMARVGYARYLPAVVTNYLIGRQGQSMEKQTAARDYRYTVQVTKGILERYPTVLANANPASVAYYTKEVGRILRDVYFSFLTGIGGIPVSGDLAAFDAFVKTVPELERDFGDITGGTRRYQVPLIEIYRKGPAAWESTKRRMKVALFFARIKGSLFKTCSRIKQRAADFFLSEK